MPKKVRVRCGHGTINKDGLGFRAEVMIEKERIRRRCATEEEAQLFLEETWRQSVNGISPDKSRITWSELVEMFLEDRANTNIKKTTLQAYRNDLRYCAKWGKLGVQRLSDRHIRNLISELRQREKPLAPKSIYNVRGTIHAALQFAVYSGVTDHNVCSKVKAPQVPEVPMEVWTREQLQAFLKAIEGDRIEALLWLIASTGVRKGEAIALKWSDLDLQTGEIIITRRLTRLAKGGGIDIDTPKSRAGARIVFLPNQALVKLRVWQQKQQEEKELAGRDWREAHWVFTSRNGNHFEPRWINKHLSDILAQHKLTHISVHGLRHTFVSLLLQSGESVRDVQTTVGHSKPSVTMNKYWKELPGAGARVANKIGEILK